ncbi:MAG: alpha/beta hydrolase family protein [Promethearchaeota archaeon]
MEKIDVRIPRRGSVGGELAGILHATGVDAGNTPLVVMCHGFTGDKYEWGRFTRTAEVLNGAGFDALLFDFSGSGANPREPVTLSKQVRDLEDVHAWAVDQGYTSVPTIGLSFGGITSLLADLPQRPCAVFWAPAFYMKKVIGPARMAIARLVSAFRKKPLAVKSAGNDPILVDRTFIRDIRATNPDPALEGLDIPALVVQGTADTAVRPELTRAAFSKMPKDDHHRLVEVEGATHDFDGRHLEEFIKESVGWLERYARGRG